MINNKRWVSKKDFIRYNARDLVDLCDGVYIARRRSDLRREFALYETILRLYRSPEALVTLTGGELKHE